MTDTINAAILALFNGDETAARAAMGAAQTALAAPGSATTGRAGRWPITIGATLRNGATKSRIALACDALDATRAAPGVSVNIERDDVLIVAAGDGTPATNPKDPNGAGFRRFALCYPAAGAAPLTAAEIDARGAKQEIGWNVQRGLLVARRHLIVYAAASRDNVARVAVAFPDVATDAVAAFERAEAARKAVAPAAPVAPARAGK